MKIFSLFIFSLFSILTVSPVRAANITSITGVTLNPSNPTEGQSVTVTWTYSIDSQYNNPHALIVVSNAATLQAAGTAGQSIVMGDACVPSAEVQNGGCAIGTNVPEGSNVYSAVITIPANLTPGFTYYVIVGMQDYNVYMNPTVAVQEQNYASFTIPLPPPYIILNKVAEGSTANVGSEVLFTINYNVANIHNFTITDSIPSQFTIVTIYNGGTSSGQNISWSLGNISSPVQSFVQVLCTLNTGNSGQVFSNTAYGQSTEVSSTPSNAALVTVSEPGLTISKSAPASVNTGSPITYVMNYTNTGTELSEFQNFDNDTIPSSWISTGGIWTAAPGYLEQTESCTALTTYPYLTDSSMTPILNAIYQVDMQVSSLDCNNFDAVFNFNETNSTGTAPETVWQAHISSYKGSNGAQSDALAFDENGTNISYISPPNMGNIQNNAWYTVKIQVCSNQVEMKIWPQGTLEPGPWDLVTNYSIPTAGWAGFQANRGPVAFTNLYIFSVIGATNPVISDVIPSNITYQGCGGGTGCSENGGAVTWNVGSTCGSSSAVSWWGLVGPCANPIVNSAVISSSSGPAPVTSNAVTTVISGCATSTPTNTATSTPTPTLMYTPTLTATNTATPSPTNTATLTATLTATNSPTLTNSKTPTNTDTVTDTSSPTQTPTQTYTPTPSGTPTNSATITPTLPNNDIFYVDHNYFVPSQGPVSIEVEYSKFPGSYSLMVYNSAGEHIRTLDSQYLSAPVSQWYYWDGTNKYKNNCASGIYIFYLIEPFDRKLKRVLLIR